MPVLTEVKEKKIQNDKNDLNHIMIEGENYHALSTLCYTHNKKIDVIYIDPPYNTGNKSWIYNNNYVEKDDKFKHSKWLSFMEKRLTLARKLLTNDGVMIIAIDDNEQAYLGVLLDEIFKDWERHCVTIVHNPRGVQGKNFSYNHEYAFFIFPRLKKKRINDAVRKEVLERNFRVDGGNSPRNTARNCFYPIYVKDMQIIGFGDVCSDTFSPKNQTIERSDGVFEIYPVDIQNIERKWSFARQTVEDIKDSLIVKKTTRGYEIKRLKDKSSYKTVWQDSKFDANEYGSKLLNSILPNSGFSFPKSIYTILECLKAVINNKDTTILDFFAGSGTTGHAVLEFNKEDGGKRQFILCTNNENNNGNGNGGVAEGVCYPRLKKVMNGYTNSKKQKIDGLGGNLRYYKTDFVNQVRTDNDKRKLVNKSTEMLCLTENTFDKIVEEKNSYAIFQNSKKITGIIYDEDAIDNFKEAIKKLDKPLTIYVFSYDHTYDKEDFKDIEYLVEIKPIPEVILNIYRNIYKKIHKTKSS